MAIPKMKLYRLEQNYSPDNDTDLKSITDDELYPFVEKSLDLNTFERLIGVTYRDLMVGKSYDTDGSGNAFTRELDMYSNDGGLTADIKKTEVIDCDGWKRGRNALKVSISLDGTTFSDVVPESYYRVNYTTESRLYDAGGVITTNTSLAVSKRQGNNLQIEFGELIYTDNVFIESGQTIAKVKVEYSLFSNNIFTEDSGVLSLECGNIYDGTREGRLGTINGTGYGYEADADGLPLKAEGNIGYKAKVYPCRQKVALQSGTDSLWDADYTISPSGSILIEGCQDWILAPTDERRPRLFERVVIDSSTGKMIFRELELNTQYTTTIIPGKNGNIDLMLQLSPEYYNITYGVYAYPKELFIRYNEEDDILEDLFVPDYLNYDEDGEPQGEEGVLDTDLSDFSSVEKQIFRMAVTSNSGYENGRDLLLEHSSGTATINLGIPNLGASLKLYYNEKMFYYAGNTMVDSPFTVGFSGAIITLTPKSGETELPLSILVSYKEPHSAGLGKANGQKYWSFGYRICCYEKTKTAKEFVSSFRNWVSNHLNNNPDIFVGWQEYQGSNQNSMAISYLTGGYSILYREGSITFPEEITQNDFQDIRNFPPSGAVVGMNVTNASLKRYLKQVYAKFAYYDGIRDVTNGLLREFNVSPGVYKYRLIDDPTYSDLEDQRWIIRNDNKMPTTFFYKNAYLPTPNYVETGDCEIYRAISMNEGETLVMNLSSYREIAIKNTVDFPDIVLGSNGDIEEKTFTLVVDTLNTDETQKNPSYTGNGTRFSVVTRFEKRQNSWHYYDTLLKQNNTTVLNRFSSRGFDPEKTIEENILSRARYVFQTNEGIPYNVVFETGENNLLIYAEKK